MNSQLNQIRAQLYVAELRLVAERDRLGRQASHEAREQAGRTSAAAVRRRLRGAGRLVVFVTRRSTRSAATASSR
jgi:hypothetical protein